MKKDHATQIFFEMKASKSQNRVNTTNFFTAFKNEEYGQKNQSWIQSRTKASNISSACYLSGCHASAESFDCPLGSANKSWVRVRIVVQSNPQLFRVDKLKTEGRNDMEVAWKDVLPASIIRSTLRRLEEQNCHISSNSQHSRNGKIIADVLVDFNLLIIRRGVLLLLLRAAVTDVVRALLSISVTSTSHSRCAKTSGWIWRGSRPLKQNRGQKYWIS